MKLILSGENIIKSLFYTRKDSIEIWKNAVPYLSLSKHAWHILSYFGSTNCCESTFSHTTQIKINLRWQITEDHLDQLKLWVTKIHPDIAMPSRKCKSRIHLHVRTLKIKILLPISCYFYLHTWNWTKLIYFEFYNAIIIF